MKIKDLLKFLTISEEPFAFHGNEEEEICGFSSLKSYKQGTFTWIKAINCIPQDMDIGKCSLIITEKNDLLICKNVIYTQNSKRVFFSLIEYFYNINNDENKPELIGKNTYIAKSVFLGENVIIGHNCTIDGDVTIGRNSVIGNNVSITGNVSIGENALIGTGVSIGDSDLAYVDGIDGHRKMIKHYGGVEIGNNVYIGTNSVISRGTIDNTVIGDDSSIDAFCHISHNCILGKRNTIVDGSYLYGSVETGDDVYIASSIVKNQMKIGNNVVVGMNSTVMSDIEADMTVVGTPAKQLVKK